MTISTIIIIMEKVPFKTRPRADVVVKTRSRRKKPPQLEKITYAGRFVCRRGWMVGLIAMELGVKKINGKPGNFHESGRGKNSAQHVFCGGEKD
jgi:hypothetical protein